MPTSPRRPGPTRTSQLAVLLVAASLLAGASARAALVDFASFDMTDASRPFQFTNNGGTGGSLAASTTVTFSFTPATGLSPVGRAASLTISNASTSSPATASGGDLVQPITGTGTLVLTELSTGRNLLTMLFTGDIVGASGGSTASLAGSTATGRVVSFTSDYLVLNAPVSSYHLSLASLNPSLAPGPGGFLSTFAAEVGGRFSVDFAPAVIPEPSAALLLGVGVGVAGLAAWRRARRRA